MPSRYPVQIGLVSGTRLDVDWDDGHHSEFGLDHLRSLCPCATCRQTKPSTPPRRRTLNVLGPAAMFEVGALEHIGSYALGISWADGHRSILSFSYLSESCPCSECRPR